MKALPLDASHRQYLEDRQAICIDSDRNEILLGLTASESMIYLHLLDQTLANDWPDELEMLSQFLSMHDRHTSALADWAWLYPVAYGIDVRVSH